MDRAVLPRHGRLWLGLSLVAAVAKLHGGKLQFSDNRPGLRATLRFASLADNSQSRFDSVPAPVPGRIPAEARSAARSAASASTVS